MGAAAFPLPHTIRTVSYHIFLCGATPFPAYFHRHLHSLGGEVSAVAKPANTVFLYGRPGDYTNYQLALEAVGLRPVVNRSLMAALACGGLLLPGGGDIHGRLPPEETFLLRAFWEARRPILGICRGMQALNVFFGGTLHARIPGHQQAQGDLIHPTRARGLLSQLLGPAPLVNSNHHQAVRVLGEELCLLQQAADGTIEGFCHETLPILGVQWHPERQSGARLRADAVDAGPLLRYFVGQCSCKSAPGLVHCEKRGEADESHHTGSKSGAGTAYGG